MISELFSENAFLWSCVWQSSICIGLGLTSSLVLRRRPCRAHRVLFLAMIAAVLVPVMSVMVKHFELGVFAAKPVVIQTEVEDGAWASDYEASAVIAVEDIESELSVSKEGSAPAVVGSRRIEFSWSRVVLWGWIAASLILTVRLAVALALGVRLLGRAIPLGSEKIQKAVRVAKQALGFGKDVKVYSSDEICSPVIWCWGRRPILLVPKGAERSGDSINWVSVICHELAHWKRRDHITGLLAELVICVLPWHPLVWWGKRRLVRLSEQACDDWVVASGQAGADYAESLLDLAPQRQMAFAPAVVSSEKGLGGRVRRILQDGCGNPGTGVMWGLVVSIVVMCAAVGVSFAQSQPAKMEAEKTEDSGRSGQRIVHFPKDRSLGQLMVVQDASIERRIDTFLHWVDGTKWEYFGEAMGDVRVPASKRLGLFITNPAAWRDLSPLAELRPEDLYMVSISGYYQDGPKPNDKCMKYLASLTGLKVLALNYMNITNKGIKYLKGMKSLERLTLGSRITSSGLAAIGQLKSLKGLYLRENNITNGGLRFLAKLTSLEELDLRGKRIGDEGLVHLAGLPSLRYLLLFGENFSDDGMVHLKNIPSLKILHIGSLKQITDAGLAHLSELTNLENVSFHWNENITNEGLAHLEDMASLRKLDISHSQVTDAGIAHLAEMKSLEYLDLPSRGITDKGLAYVAELENLKHFRVARSHYVDPNMDTDYYTDTGIKELSKLHLLEELTIGSIGVTNTGMSHIAKLTNLRDLWLFGCPELTNEGLAKLTTLKSLKKLNLSYTKVTISGLACLDALPKLTNFDVYPLVRDDSVLDIAGLTGLEELSLGFSRRSGDSFGDADLVCLAKLKRLKWLQIYPRKFSNAGMVHLAGLTNMERLGIGGAGLTDDGLFYLGSMKKLNHLTINNGLYSSSDRDFGSGGNFTDKGLSYLEGLKVLRSLTINAENAFSPAALERLRQKLPNLVTFRTGNEGAGYGGGRTGAVNKRRKQTK